MSLINATQGLELNFWGRLSNTELLERCKILLNNDCLEIISNMYEERFKKERLEYTRNLEGIERIRRRIINPPIFWSLLRMEIHFEIYNFLNIILMEDIENRDLEFLDTYCNDNMLIINPERKYYYNMTCGFRRDENTMTEEMVYGAFLDWRETNTLSDKLLEINYSKLYPNGYGNDNSNRVGLILLNSS